MDEGSPARSRPVSWRDAWLPGALLAVGVVELATVRPDGWGWAVLLEAVSAVLLVGRRVRPLVFATLAAVVMLLMPWIGPQLDEPAVPIMFWTVSMYALARWLPDLKGLLGVGLIMLVVAADYRWADERVHSISDVMFSVALVAPPYVLGRLTRRLAQQSALLRRNQELVRREAVRDERDRIARELHDVIAHSVSAMVVQTAAAQDLVRTDPGRAESVLADVAATGRRALVETGRLLHVLRDEHDELGLNPAPGLAQLPDLVAGFRASGLTVDLHVEQPLPQLPPVVDVSAYRIVQEALTNALKHGADRTAALRLSADGSALAICASNPAGARPGGGSGLGLMGMSERVALLGGRLTHGRDGDGSFRLDVSVPLAAPEPA